ncbi:MAG: 2,4-didehydro-3-deoxy-L-rhamnonate hydrolase [Ilumatobacteraceae bacterium]|jgi:2-keto-4-pentenoate hydratase/2-oxohepta-3-ene-1,7-dioic acid hydratase in catechol pathway
MRLFNLADRLSTFVGGAVVDVATASDNRFSPDPQRMFEDWQGLVEWGKSINARGAGEIDLHQVHAPVPRPPQVFAIGLNYRAHAEEGIFSVPDEPTVFTKWPSCIVGPSHEVELQVDTDWEIELVVAISHDAYRVPAADAMSCVAGYTIGQDLSDRVLQRKGPAPQWSLGKSRYGYGPTGPWLVTLDEFDNPLDLAIHDTLAGESLQSSRTSMLIFDIPVLIEYLSGLCPLMPGDLIFTGTPEGVGYARNPPRFLHPGDELTSTIEGIGDLVTRFV